MSFCGAYLDGMWYIPADKHPAGNTEDISGKCYITNLPYFNTLYEKHTF